MTSFGEVEERERAERIRLHHELSVWPRIIGNMRGGLQTEPPPPLRLSRNSGMRPVSTKRSV